jgi:hypothetical protein
MELLLSYFMILLSIFFIAILLSHFPLFIAQSFFIAALLKHFVQPFSIEQCHYFTKWLSWADGITHSFARS